MKGKNIFTKSEILELHELVKKRIQAKKSQQKCIRNRMRIIGFYGKDDFHIVDMQPADLDHLISTGRIKILNEIGVERNKILLEQIIPFKKYETPSRSTEIDPKIFIRFNPLTDFDIVIPNAPGNYILCLNEGSSLPDIGITFLSKKINNLDVIYTGIASRSLRTRDYRQHFCGNNAGRSTLRKSLGAMFNYKQIPRDKDPNTGKTKFSESDEIKLSEWMKGNLILYYYQNDSPELYENSLIEIYNPPLNLNQNKAKMNELFRNELSRLRNMKEENT